MVSSSWTISFSFISAIFFSRFPFSCTWPCLFTETVTCLVILFLPDGRLNWAKKKFWYNMNNMTKWSQSLILVLKTKKYLLCIVFIVQILCEDKKTCSLFGVSIVPSPFVFIDNFKFWLVSTYIPGKNRRGGDRWLVTATNGDFFICSKLPQLVEIVPYMYSDLLFRDMSCKPLKISEILVYRPAFSRIYL